ncbi:hypothetical protein C8Q74DRAFT_1222719 [Fomes fomentarius]|nr:hypothetical protein C8Q74DRAFT_1222719 [Fomes fomentarius]
MCAMISVEVASSEVKVAASAAADDGDEVRLTQPTIHPEYEDEDEDEKDVLETRKTRTTMATMVKQLRSMSNTSTPLTVCYCFPTFFASTSRGVSAGLYAISMTKPPVGAASIRAAQENRPIGRQLKRGRGSRHGQDDDSRHSPSVRPHFKFIDESDVDVWECGHEGLRAALRAVEQVDGVDSQLPQV